MSTNTIDLSALRADPDITETKDIRGIQFEFRTRLPAKSFTDLDLNPIENKYWEFDLQEIVVKSPVLTREEFCGMDTKARAEVTVETMDIAGLNARPTFR